MVGKRSILFAPLAFLVLLLLVLFLLSSAPAVSLDPSVTVLGLQTPLPLAVQSPHGLRRLSVFAEQNNTRYPLAERRWPASRWTFWRHSQPPASLVLTASAPRNAALRDGPATLIVEAVANDFRAASASLSRPIAINTQPPRVSADGEQHYINQGGAELVQLTPSGYWTSAGVQVGNYRFTSFPTPSGAGRFSLFAFPWDVSPDTVPQVFARNPAGALATAPFVYKLFPKPPRKRDFDLTDEIMTRLVNQIAPNGSGDLLTRFLAINRDMRRGNNRTLSDLRLQTAPRFLFSTPFQQQPNSKVESVFADVRSYMYQGKKVDEEVHLGFDLSVTQHVPVQAANDGRVLFAAPLGIYGNCIVVDHGYGIQSIYGHLSQIDVKPGDPVKKGQVMGRSGSTGLALGDHLHFSIQLDGVQVNPVEWWDGHWLKDHIWNRVGMPAEAR